MTIKSVFDSEFARYGKVIDGIDTKELLHVLVASTDCPKGAVTYVPSFDKLEELAIFAELRDRVYGGMPIQIGYCNGDNHLLNCLEYHRDSEINIAAVPMVFLVAPQHEIKDSRLDTACVEAFAAPAGAAVELYATTLHYAPVNGAGEDGFRVAVVLPKGTNTDKPEIVCGNWEDKMLFARNKWLIAHPDAPEANQGAVVGLIGENIRA